MKTLIIYDEEGFIFTQISGTFRIPVGIQHIIVDLSEHEYVERIDVAETEHKPVLKRIEKTPLEQEIDILKFMVADLGLKIGGNL